MDTMMAIGIIEGNYEVDEDIYIEAWQSIINSGIVWQLQGSYQRGATALIEMGKCTHGT